MDFRKIKEKLYQDRLYKGVLLGFAAGIALAVVIGVPVFVFGGKTEKTAEIRKERTDAPVRDESAVPDDASASEKIAENSRKQTEDAAAGDEMGSIYEYGIPIMLYDKVEGSVKKGDFFSTVMSRLGVAQSDIYTLDSKAKGVFDMKQFKVGNHYHAYYPKDGSGKLAYLVYEKDRTSYVLFTLTGELAVEVFSKDIATEVDYVEVEIVNSLWQDVIDAGAPALLAIKLADIYAWTIDFFGLQKGDSFKAVFEKTICDGQILNVENVLYSEFTHGNTGYKSYWFDDGSGNYYWNEKGESMRKAFLKAPLSYTRISSGFTYRRLHPVTRQLRPHTGVDYAAPAGTEVMSIGDGVVVYKGYKKAEGHMVKIKHNSVYTTAYLHLSRYGKGVEVGQRVRQGQVIGYVGSTGYSTGPHLDFRVWKNGSPVNPLKMDSPPAEPVSKKNMDAFLASRAASEKAANSFKAKSVLRRMLDDLSRCL